MILREVSEHLTKDFPPVYHDVLKHSDFSSLTYAPLVYRYPWGVLFGKLAPSNHDGWRRYAPNDPRFGPRWMFSARGGGGIGSALWGLDCQARRTCVPRYQSCYREVCKGEEIEGDNIDSSLVHRGLASDQWVQSIVEVPK